MTSFKILTNRLPVKWQTELREILGTAVAPAAATETKNNAEDIVVTAENTHIVETLLHWIQRMNRHQQKPSKNNFPNQGINLTLQRQDGNRITLTERNASVVKQFLGS
ncbi:MAG: hypothetical protein ALAOOOJD_02858 [bacterium]|nr:hypothetical protein [bacterium]